MKRMVLVGVVVAAAQVAAAQMTTPATDVLGAHLNSGRGCVACHAPHSGANGNGTARMASAGSGDVALWGEDAPWLYGTTIATDGGKYTETLPASLTATTPDAAGMLTCLTCHDGNYASNAMMKNKVYETLPASYGTAGAVPTLLGSNGNFLSEHPMGLNAAMTCGGDAGWDCSESGGVIRMSGTNSARFVANYGFFVKPGSYNNTAVVVCTTCHEPHVMSTVRVTAGSQSGLPAGTYATMFFLRGPYNPNDPNPLTNQTAQFCRQCHADTSNEMNGSVARTVF